MNYTIRQLLKNKLVPAILSIVLGVVIILARRAALDLLVKIIGGLVIASGAAFIIIYLLRPDPEAGNLKMILLLAAAAVLVGILLITKAKAVVNFFPTLMGILLILNGLSNLTEASVDEENRPVVITMGVIIILFGILIVARPGLVADTLMILIGSFFVVSGIFDLIMLRRMKERLWP